jgi:hypothetical protein
MENRPHYQKSYRCHRKNSIIGMMKNPGFHDPAISSRQTSKGDVWNRSEVSLLIKAGEWESCKFLMKGGKAYQDLPDSFLFL